jgi:hypothetical protein
MQNRPKTRELGVISIEHDMSDGLAFASELPRHFGAARMLVQWIIPL